MPQRNVDVWIQNALLPSEFMATDATGGCNRGLSGDEPLRSIEYTAPGLVPASRTTGRVLHSDGGKGATAHQTVALGR